MKTSLLWSSRLLRLFRLKAEIDRFLVLSVCFSLFLLAVRIFSTHSLLSASLAWNLFLAWFPYGLSSWLYRHTALLKGKWVYAVLFLVWLLFIPNSFYIITDLFHLHDARNAPLWYDLLLIFSFAWNGLLMGILSIRSMEKVTQVFLPFRYDWTFLYPVMLLNALGVFIGRYLRYNSWDVVVSPVSLTADMLRLLLHPALHKQEWAMVLSYSLFMTMLYVTIKKISRLIW
ncbi:MAG: DUF1361 domain-containing protein [Williamsia sp.]|nr:DUF1361 domain-containing protein [Williamsia sp.]